MSLVEIMVGVLVALIGCVVIFQMYSVADARKRTVSSGSDMDISGRLGLMTLQRDLQLAGYGFGAAAALSSGALLGCNVTAYDSGPPARGDFTFAFAPLLMVDGTVPYAGAPDTLVSLRGSSGFIVAPKIFDGSAATTKRIKADSGGRTGVQRGDVVIATKVSDGLCAMFEITGDANADTLTLDHATGNYLDPATGLQRTARYNKPGGIAFAFAGEGTLYNLGVAPARNIWSVQNNKLVVSNDLVSGGTAIEAADLIVNLQAEYGVDADDDGRIEAGEWTTVNPAPADWRKLFAVRFALLARSTQFEPTKVTTANPRWAAGPFTMRNLDGAEDDNPGGSSGNVNNWRNYRYNVFEAVVPLRNAIVGRQL